MSVSRNGTRAILRLRKKIQGLQQNLMPEIVEEIGKAALSTVEASFDRGVDPDGKPWASPKDGGKPLVRTGRLRDSFRIQWTGKLGFRIVSDAIDQRSSPKFQRKTSTILPRGPRKYAQLVTGERAIVWRRRHTGKRWMVAFRKAIKAVLKRHEAALLKP